MPNLRSTRDRVVGFVFGAVFGVVFLLGAGHIVVRLLSDDPPDVGDEAPAFVLDGLDDGARIATEELRGRVLLVDFWQTTCVGCVGATPKLNRLFERYQDDGFLVVGVNREPDQPEAVRTFVAEREVKYPVVVDPGHVADAYGIYSTPTVVLIGADGKIRSKHIGGVTERTLRKEIDAALAAR